MKKLLLSLAAVFCFGILFAREWRCRGVVTDSCHRTPVPYAVVYVHRTPFGTVADNLGRFSLSAPDSVRVDTLVVAAEGFELRYLAASDIRDRGEANIRLIPDAARHLQPEIASKIAESPNSPLKMVAKIARGIIDDWLPLGDARTNKFDLGRIQTFPTVNPVEGFRLRLGAASNARLSPRFFVKGYVAYGFKDKKPKYRGEAAYSFDEKAYHENEFPKNNLRLVYENDIYAPGDAHPRDANDFLLSAYRLAHNQMTYRRFADLSYEREFQNGLAPTLWLRKSRIRAQSNLLNMLPRTDDNTPRNRQTLNLAQAGFSLRYSFREAYLQEKRKRSSVEMLSPVFLLGYSVGTFNGPESNSPYHRLDFSAQKRFLLGNAGRLDVVGEFSKLWNIAPVPLLLFPAQRMEHAIENKGSFLTQSLEFPADEQYVLRATFVAEELFLSGTEVSEGLHAREFFSMKIAYGKLNEKNYPLDNRGIYPLPPMSCRYNEIPYVEGSLGITGIFGLLRVEYVHRFTHRDTPNALLGLLRVDIPL